MNPLQVGHIKQRSATSCNAACLAMLYNYFGCKQKETEIWNRLKTRRPSVEGDWYINMNDILKDIKKNNFNFIIGRSYWDFKNSFQPLRVLIKAGLPIMVIQKGHPNPTLGHCRVVVGIDKYYVIVNDPESDTENLKIKKQAFYDAWEQSGKEVTGGVLLTIFPRNYQGKIEKLLLDDVTTNIDKILWAESAQG